MIPLVVNNTEIVAIDKPSGMLSIPGRDPNDKRLVVHKELESQLGEKLWVVHRLDAEVSGLMVFAKNAAVHRSLSMAFEGREVKKTYEAWSYPLVFSPGNEERWESKLLRGKKRAYEGPTGKDAVTQVKCTEIVSYGDQKVLRWTLHPETGRSHQLRFELFKHGTPIVGDSLYGSKIPFGEGNAIALRCVALEFSEALKKQCHLAETRLVCQELREGPDGQES